MAKLTAKEKALRKKARDEKKKELAKIPPSPPTAIVQKEKPIELDIATVKKYINPNVTDSEAYMFLQLCKAQRLNPFIKECYLVKYGNAPATMIVGKDVFTKRAHHNPLYNGLNAGIIVRKKKGTEIIYRRGSFYIKLEEDLLGGWTEVFRKDQENPVRIEVSMGEYNTGKASWVKMPATMIRKVAVVQGLREAFPDDFQGLYDASEMGGAGVDPEQLKDINYKVDEPQVEKPVEEKKKEKPKNITPDKYKIPADITPLSECNLGPYKNKPKKYSEIPLDKLETLHAKAENPEALEPVLRNLYESSILMVWGEGKHEGGINDFLKVNYKKTCIMDLDLAERKKVLVHLNNIAKKKGGENGES